MSVLCPTKLPLSTDIVFTDFVLKACPLKTSRYGSILFLKGTVTFNPSSLPSFKFLHSSFKSLSCVSNFP